MVSKARPFSCMMAAFISISIPSYTVGGTKQFLEQRNTPVRL